MDEDDIITDIKFKMTDKKIRRYSAPNSNRKVVVRRPEEILRDVRGLKLRQRVSLVLGDEILKEELEESIRNINSPTNTRKTELRTYQDFLIPLLPPFCNNTNYISVLPIDDIRGEKTVQYTKNEKSLRCKLAAVYRLIDINGWSQSIFNHASICIDDAILLNPFGLLYSEVTASSLIKCSFSGELLDNGSTSLGLNKAGFVLHSAVHQARPDIKCVVHIHHPDVVAVSSMKCGFLRLSQESLILGGISYHDYYGLVVDDEEKQIIVKDLGPENMVMFLRNHGAVVCGTSIENAYNSLYNLILSCQTQVKAIAHGVENLSLISEEAYNQLQERVKNNNIMHAGDCHNITVNVLQFEALMRKLDSQGYRTGYTYHKPDIFTPSEGARKPPKAQIPPQTTSDRDVPHRTNYERNPALGVGNTHHNKMKWLNNNPVQGTQYKKEPREEAKPVYKEVPKEEGLTNGHAEEEKEELQTNGNVEETTKTTKDSKIVAKERKGFASTEKNSVTLNETTTTTSVVETSEKPSEEKEEESSNQSSSSLHESSFEASGGSSSQKVKKQKSFKKALFKKLHKKDEKKEEKSK